MTTAEEALKKIEQQAAASAPSLRTLYRMKAGDVIRQGDVYLERLEKLPKELGAVTKNRQLAVGETQGSRHVLRSPFSGKIYSPPEGAGPLVGPVLDARARLRLEHPEHGHFDLPAGVYQVTYQRDFARERAEEVRRVTD